MSLANIDRESLDLILQLQLDDLASLTDKKGKAREGETTDLQVAIETYKTELQSQEQIIADRAMCRSIGEVVRRDTNTIAVHPAEENPAAHDRRHTLVLGGRRVNNAPTTSSGPGTTTTRESPAAALNDKNTNHQLSVVRENSPEDVHAPSSPKVVAESSSMARSRPSESGRAETLATMDLSTAPTTTTTTTTTAECISCGDNHHAVAQCPCSHEYCYACLETLFRSSLTDESLFPPRCCGQPIPIGDDDDDNSSTIRAFIPAGLVDEFLAKKVEFETPDRTYCHQPTCSTFIPKIPSSSIVEGDGEDVAACPKCHAKTCVICKGPAHQGDCPHDAVTQEVLRVAAENGWQRCYSCRRIVEIEHGCNHMTCLCGAQFCYECGLRWKTCRCPQWRESRLLARASNVVDRDIAEGRVQEAQRADQVERQRRHLMEFHDCRHANWRYLQGAHRCDECRDVLPSFIYECTNCRIMACHRCRYNRIRPGNRRHP